MGLLTLIIKLTCCAKYSLSTDKKIFTAYVSEEGVPEPLSPTVVQDSKVHSFYVTAVVSEGINELESGCFAGCFSLKNVSLSGTVKYIGSQSFLGCSSLTEIDFPHGMEKIQNEALRSCSSLVKVTFPSTMEYFGTSVFMYSGIKEIKVTYNAMFSSNKQMNLLIENKTIIRAVAPSVDSVTVPKEIIVLVNDCMSYSGIKNIYFEENCSLTTVSSRSFYQSQISSIELPEGTLRVLSYAFHQATSLKSIHFPSSLIEISASCLGLTDSLKNVTVGPNCSALDIDKDGIVFMKSDYAVFFMPLEIQEFTIQNKTTTITENILQSRKNLTKLNTVDEYHPKFLTFNNTLYNKATMSLVACVGGAVNVVVHPNCTSIGSSAFRTVGLEVVDLSGTKVKSISSLGFSKTKKMKSILFSDILESIGGWSLAQTGVTSLEFPSSLLSLGESIISGSMVKIVDLSKCSKLKSIPEKAFQQGTNLEVVKFPTNGSSIIIYSLAFEYCTSLKNITFGRFIDKIMDQSFQNSGLSKIEFADECNIKSFGASAFKNCPLVSIRIPDSVGEIGEYCFAGCTKLSSVTFGENSNLESLSPNVFNGCIMESIKFGKNLSKVYECGFTGCDSLTEIELFDGNQNFSVINNCLYSIDKKTFVVCPPGLQIARLAKETSAIAGSAFYGCKKLTNVVLNEDSIIAEIGSSTFYGCEVLESIKLPKYLRALRSECFRNCKCLESVIFPTDCQIEIVEFSAFFESGLQSIDFGRCKNLSIISESSFEGCQSLEVVILPPSLRSLKTRCFSNCQILKTIKYCPNIDSSINFEPPHVADGAFFGCNELIEIIVPNNFPNETFGELFANRILDGDCNLPTIMFSIQTNKVASPILSSICGEVYEEG